MFSCTSAFFGIVISNEYEELTQIVEVPESQKRYGIDIQTNDILDTMLSTVPNHLRTKEVMTSIHNLILRYTELRTKFSKFDQNGNIYSDTQYGHLYKPLTERIEKLDTRIRWLIPVVSQHKKLYDIPYFNESEQSNTKDDIIFLTSTDLGITHVCMYSKIIDHIG